MSHIIRTTDYLRNRLSALENRMQCLEEKEQEQMAHRKKYSKISRGPSLPREVIQKILSHVPTRNYFKVEHLGELYVDGILPHVVFNPSSLLPYVPQIVLKYNWLQDIANESINLTVLDDVSLVNTLELRAVTVRTSSVSKFIRLIRSTRAFHRLKSLNIQISGSIDLDELVLMWPPQLEDLSISCSQMISKNTTSYPFGCSPLKALEVAYDYFPVGIQFRDSLTKLALFGNCGEERLPDLADMLSQLVCLEELCLAGRIRDAKLDELPDSLSRFIYLAKSRRANRNCDVKPDESPKVISASLRSLNLINLGYPNTFRTNYSLVEPQGPRYYEPPFCSQATLVYKTQ